MILVSNKGHMSSTKNLKELHSFAKTIGLEKEMFIPTSNDVPISFYYVKSRKKRKEAIRSGAKLVKGPEFLLQILASRQFADIKR